MVNFTLRQCRYFAAVARHGGVAQAARELNISQPAVAEAINKLEEMHGLTLFHRRHAKGMELTLQGRAFLEECRQLLATADNMDQRLDEIARQRRGTIRLGCFHSIAPFCMARLVMEYAKMQPDVSVEASEDLQQPLINGLADGRLDLALLYNLSLDPTQLAWQVIARPLPYVLLPEAHALAAREQISLDALATEPYVLFDAADSRDYFFRLFAGHGITPKVAFRARSLESVRSAVGQGLGYSLLAMQVPGDDTYDGNRVVCRPLSDAMDPIEIVVARSADIPATGLLNDFMEFAGGAFPAPPV